jgi:hypothetical protein
MNAQNLARKLVVGIALVCFFTGYVRADKLQLQAKLSKQIKIELRDVTVAKALEKIGEKADVKILLSDEAAWKLPQGEATRLSVMMQGPLAESLTEMLNAFFMRYAVGGEEITIYPRPELERILGRSTAEQLDLLRDLCTKRIEVYKVGDAQTTINDMLGRRLLILPVSVQERVDYTLRQLLLGKLAGSGLEIESGVKRNETHKLPTPITVAQLLDQVVIVVPDRRRNTTFNERVAWYISGMQFPNQVPEVRLVSQKQFREAKLDQVVDVSFEDERAEVILRKLANWTGMEFIVDAKAPSWLSERISVDMQNVSLRQAIRNVAATVDGYAGINVEEHQIVVEGPIHEKKLTTAKESASGDYVGKISIPMEGGKYHIEFMLRESDLTEELKKLRKEKMREILGESPKPAEKPNE